MLTIHIPETELFDDNTQKFVYVEGVTITLEHSLVSLSKWEQTWEKPFLGKDPKTNEEFLDYVRCMTVSPDVPKSVYFAITQTDMNRIGDYINAKMTATWFAETPNRRQSEVVTNEIIYYWLVALEIPFEVQHWHLNRLLTLVRVANIKNDPKKKMMPKRDVAAQQRALNAQRKQQLGTKG